MMSYFTYSIDSYDKYLRRTIGMRISNINKIYSYILSLTDSKRNSTVKSIHKAFENGRDKLNPIAVMTNLLPVKEYENF
jgi:hypothetical protein